MLWGELFFRLRGMRGNRRAMDLLGVQRLLLIRLDEIGDVVMTTPFLRECRRNFPQAWITLVVKPSLRNLVETCPYTDEVLTYDWNVPYFHHCKHAGSRPHLERHKRALRLARRHLWGKRFDLAILPRWGTDFYNGAFLAYFSGAGCRVGYSEKNSAHGPRFYEGVDDLLTQAIFTETPAHEVERTLNVLTFLKGNIESTLLELWTAEGDEQFASDALNSKGNASDGPFIAFGLGAGESKRVWPIENFIELGEWLTQTYNAQIVLVGGPSEVEMGRQFQQSVSYKIINVIGNTTLRQTAAVLKRCSLFVGNDSGPMHIAAAVGSVVAEISCHPLTGSLEHPNSPHRFGPWGEAHVVLQPAAPLTPCFDGCTANEPHCILGVEVDQVKAGIRERFKCQADFSVVGASNHAN